MLAVLGVAGVAAAVAVPATTRTASDLRLSSNARSIHNMVSRAKLRAATRYSRERFVVDLATKSFFLQYWDKATGDWVTEAGSSRLSSGIDFSFGTLSAPPPNTQNAIQQAAPCLSNTNAVIANTACVTFNSRGIPIDSTGAPTGNTAFYLTDRVGVYGITLSATPLVRLWWSPARATAWVHK